MGEPVSTTALIGMAVAAAGTAVKYQQEKKRAEEIGDIAEATSRRNEKFRQKSQAAWEQELGQLSPEEQQKRIDEETMKRQQAYEAAAADVPEGMNIVKASEDAPAIVKTEAAKQLGNKLDSARGQIRAQAKLAGMDQNSWLRQLGLARTSENLGMYGNFIRGNQNAAGVDMNIAANNPMLPIGDILSAAGGGMMSIPSSGATTALPAATAADNQWLNWYNQIG